MTFETPITAANALVNQMDWLRSIVQSRLSNRAAAEDVLQEVAIAALRNQQQFETIEAVRSWLYRVSIRQIALLQRHEIRHRDKVERYAQQSMVNAGLPYIQDLHRNEATSMIQLALNEVSEDDRRLLLERYQNGKRCSVIANERGVSETAIQSRLLRARRRLRSIILHLNAPTPPEADA